MTATPRESRGQKSSSFRVGRVQAYLRGRVWYLRYQEEGQRRQPRVGLDRQAARQPAAEINAQLEVGPVPPWASNRCRSPSCATRGLSTSWKPVRPCSTSRRSIGTCPRTPRIRSG